MRLSLQKAAHVAVGERLSQEIRYLGLLRDVGNANLNVGSQRAIRADPPSITLSTSAREAVLVSPGVVMASAPWATPQATAHAAGLPLSIP
jgi:hypothetical protein